MKRKMTVVENTRPRRSALDARNRSMKRRSEIGHDRKFVVDGGAINRRVVLIIVLTRVYNGSEENIGKLASRPDLPAV